MGEKCAYRVCDYSFDTFLSILVDDELGRTLGRVSRRNNAVYFKEYLEDRKAKTIVVEHEYVDTDFLDDFAAYYVRCFTTFSKLTQRIHFFSHMFSENEFRTCLSNPKSELRELLECEDSSRNPYLGFMVLKPLPETSIGRTCLKPYDEDNGRRCYPVTKRYNVGLFGIRLQIRTLAFQEQDNEVSKCATSALWTLFHGSSLRFGHTMLTPHSITMSGTKSIPDWLGANPDTRRLPNGGLSVAQVCSVIREVGLEAFLMGTKGKVESGFGKVHHMPSVRQIVNAATYAYLVGGVPILLVVRLEEQVSEKPEDISDLGLHAMTLTGFSLNSSMERVPVRHGSCEITLRTSRIDKLYAHDDQIGPFARMTWDGERRLLTSWYNLQKRKVMAIPDCMIIPLAPKIRIPYEAIERAVVALNELVGYYIKRSMKPPLEWEIRLIAVNKFKSEIVQDEFIDSDERERLATKHMPKHLWLAGAWIEDSEYPARKSIEFAIDATAIQQEGGLVDVITRDETMLACFLSAFGQETIDKELEKIESGSQGSVSLVRQVQKYLLDP